MTESSIDTVLQNVSETVLQTVVTLNATQENCSDGPDFCFFVPEEPIRNVTSNFSAEEYCKAAIGPPFAPYYYPNTTSGSLRCLSNCSEDNPKAFKCKYGICRILKTGPQCNCNDLDLYWYTDKYCQTRIHKNDVALGLPLAILFVLSIILSVLVFRAKRKKSSSSWSDDSELWYEEVEEDMWKSSEVLTFRNESACFSDGSQDTSHAFQPSLHLVDTSVKLKFQKPSRQTSPSEMLEERERSSQNQTENAETVLVTNL
ncbi:mucin-17 [Pogona vitticeps]